MIRYTSPRALALGCVHGRGQVPLNPACGLWPPSHRLSHLTDLYRVVLHVRYLVVVVEVPRTVLFSSSFGCAAPSLHLRYTSLLFRFNSLRSFTLTFVRFRFACASFPLRWQSFLVSFGDFWAFFRSYGILSLLLYL